MKKILLVALALTLGFAANAQFCQAKKTCDLNAAKGAAKATTWYQTATPFTTYDFRDTQHQHPISLQAWMDSGFCVVIDYSAVWCNPCWRLHQAGILDAFYNRFGPNGTNTVRVLWVEGDGGYGSAEILGNGSNTQGDWTMGGTVEYPMADDENVINSFPDFWNSWLAYPCVIMATPEGFYAPLYGFDDAVISTYDTATCCANLQALINNRPQAGQPPVAEIEGPLSVMNGNTATFTANYVSVEPVTSVNWTFQGGNPSSATGNQASTLWNADGDYTVTLEVTNANGTTTKTATVHVFSWNWGATMTYVTNDEYETSIGTGGAIYWGAMFPAQFMSGRAYMKDVDLYVAYAGKYKMILYQGGDNAPATQIYTRTVQFGSGDVESWQKINVSGSVALDGTKNLWVVFNTTNISYPAAGSAFCGDLNGSWVSTDGTNWMDIDAASSGQLSYTWMIKATTSNTPNAGIEDILGSELNIFPNPTTGKVNIDVENFESAVVMDIAGRTVMTSTESTIDMSNLNNGVYMIRVNTANGSATQKVVKR